MGRCAWRSRWSPGSAKVLERERADVLDTFDAIRGTSPLIDETQLDSAERLLRSDEGLALVGGSLTPLAEIVERAVARGASHKHVIGLVAAYEIASRGVVKEIERPPEAS